MKIQKAAVIGAGVMGSGIAQVLSQAGIEVLLMDVSQELVERGLSNIKRMYDSRVKKEVLTGAEADYLYAMVKGCTTHQGLESVDLIIEAALEQIEVKRVIFSELGKICPEHAILATNTSALSISEIAAVTGRPEKVIGMHFFNPAHVMKLVEVIPGIKTSPVTTERALRLCRELNKIPVKVEECPGFLVNRLLFRYLNEAMYVVEEGSATIDEVDNAVVEFGLPMGPFTLLDMSGIDVCANVTGFLYGEYGPRFEPNRLLDRMLAERLLGQKSGAGFYLHPAGKPPEKGKNREINPQLGRLLDDLRSSSPQRRPNMGFSVDRVILPMLNEAIIAVQEGVVSASDVDTAMQWGCGMTRGLLSFAGDKGLAWCLKELEIYQGELGERFRPAWLLRKLVRAGIHDFSQAGKEPAEAIS